MKNKLIKILDCILIGIVCISLSSCSTSNLQDKPILITEPEAKIPEYENPFEELVVKNSDKVRDLMLEFDAELGNNSDFPNFYSGSYLSYSSDGDVNSMVFSLVDSSVSREFVDIVNSQGDIRCIAELKNTSMIV